MGSAWCRRADLSTDMCGVLIPRVTILPIVIGAITITFCPARPTSPLPVRDIDSGIPAICAPKYRQESLRCQDELASGILGVRLGDACMCACSMQA